MTCGLVRIRLARFGRKNTPLYNVVVSNAHKARDSKPIEVLGTYNPVPRKVTDLGPKPMLVKDVELDFDRSKYWIGVGAQPSDTVIRLFKKCGILDEHWGQKYVERKVVLPRKEVQE
ncbi:hypothetical protein Kpol_1058p40 [Vanderwaltozyma polyspora DSM 70294]|uniref:Ribosomal protein S16 n=1 Tax=Vanderwaltozyma polyspora (strain ATCC 22028 / DSM 70294 / BCRC 21397 / CBS 2163 / NBRC 10782 / NRRL Y-8283 / UCD 57-17) TaxID=436907 RepID=A7TJS4_VANPO|nr:uncharacterized protein Kpol_1058p40 [Vanderwaltozyma polyspora DSM 70294]EDO17503.1 hypothetical protein Kpol_1058p40 [Vanderwaltozyma polyspora DSM 70294]